MPNITLRSHEGSYQLIIDGKDVSRDVLPNVKLELPEDPFDEATLTVSYSISVCDELDIELNDVKVHDGA